MKIAAGSTQDIPSGGHYLNIFSANRAFKVSSKSEGLDKTTVKAGYSYNVQPYSVITFHNDGVDELDIEFEVSNLQAVMGANNGVDVLNKPVIQRIEEGITVNATIDQIVDGEVKIKSPNNLLTEADVTVATESKQLIVPASSIRTATAIQIVSANFTKLRFGDINVGAARGHIYGGSVDSPGLIRITNKADVYAYNLDTVNPASLAVIKEYHS